MPPILRLLSAEILGIKATLEKPFSRASLRHAIERALASPFPR